MDFSIKQLADTALDTRPLPEVALGILRLFFDDEINWKGELLQWIKLDPALSLRMLQLSNSSNCGRPGRVSSLEEGIASVDKDTLLDGLLSMICCPSLDEEYDGAAVNYRMLWKHSLACARYSEMLAVASGFPSPSLAYLAGLLHDLAKPAIWQVYPKESLRIKDIVSNEKISLFEAEAQVLESNHSAIAARILAEWNVPATLRGAIEAHHYPSEHLLSNKTEMALARIIKVGDLLAYKLREGDAGNALRSQADVFPEEARSLLARLSPDAISAGKHDLDAMYKKVSFGKIDNVEYAVMADKAARILGRRAIVLRNSLREMQLLQQLHQVFTSSWNLEELLAGISHEVLTVLRMAAVAYLIEHKKGEPIIYLASLYPLSEGAIYRLRHTICAHFGKRAKTVIDNVTVPLEDISANCVRIEGDNTVAEDPIGTAMFSLDGQSSKIGSMCILSEYTPVFVGDEQRHFQLVAQQIAMAIDRLFLNLETKRMSITDGLTGLCNRRQFHLALEREIKLSTRYMTPVSMVIMDIDHFKNINDTYGHPAGDEILRHLAILLKSHSREIDVVARYGGEEFVVILPKTELEGARELAERIRTSVAADAFSTGSTTIKISISAGVACYPSEGIDTPERLIDASDKALYEAKESGRNKVVVAPNRFPVK